MPKTTKVREIPQTILIETTKLSEFEGNPRDINEKAFTQLKKSITTDPEFLQLRPLLAKQEGEKLVVYAGNQRLKACIALGIEKVPVIIDNEATDAQIKKRVLLDNVEYGGFSKEKVFEMYNTLELKEYDMPEIENYLIEPIVIDDISVSNNPKNDLTQMTFTVTTMQKGVIEEALQCAKSVGEFGETGNENSNGNALAAMAARYIETY